MGIKIFTCLNFRHGNIEGYSFLMWDFNHLLFGFIGQNQESLIKLDSGFSEKRPGKAPIPSLGHNAKFV